MLVLNCNYTWHARRIPSKCVIAEMYNPSFCHIFTCLHFSTLLNIIVKLKKKLPCLYLLLACIYQLNGQIRELRCFLCDHKDHGSYTAHYLPKQQLLYWSDQQLNHTFARRMYRYAYMNHHICLQNVKKLRVNKWQRSYSSKVFF